MDNYNLNSEVKFDKSTVLIINSFLRRLSAPSCLLAHNGDRSDFPLLQAELKKCGTELESNIMCADSCMALKDILMLNYKIPSNMSFSLINLHKHLFGCLPVISHGADADFLTLLKVAAVFGAEFIDWIEDNCYKFRHCHSMWNICELYFVCPYIIRKIK
jgi:three prime repair exonuclease-1